MLTVGTSSTAKKDVNYGLTYGSLPNPSRTGYIFDGWYTSIGGHNKVTSTVIDRYGYESGTFISPHGTLYEMRSLAPGTELKPYHVYKVIKPIDCLGGKIAPWFDQPGGGIQCKNISR